MQAPMTQRQIMPRRACCTRCAARTTLTRCGIRRPRRIHARASVQRRARTAEVVAALSRATDLGIGQPMDFALRTCALALRLGETLGLSATDLRTIYYVALM